MIRSRTNPEPFNGSGDIRSPARSVEDPAVAFPVEVIVTARAGHDSEWSTTIVIPQCAEQTTEKGIQ